MPTDPTRKTLAEFIKGVMMHGTECVYDDVSTEDSIREEADNFQQWVDERGLSLECPPEWLAAWAEYSGQYDDDGEPPDIDDDSHYDPYTGGDDYLREHGEEDWL